MKTIILLLLTVVCLNCNAQYSKDYNPPKGWREPELYLPATVLVSTFAVNQICKNKLTVSQGMGIAITGSITMFGTHLLFRYIREHKDGKRRIRR
jgi:hypothetical protein